MPGTEPPQMQIGQAIAIGLDHGAHTRGHAPIRIHIEQDRAGIANEAVGPDGDDNRAAETHDGVHPRPTEERPNTSAMMTSTETPASAKTCTIAERMLLSRAVAPR